MSTYLYTKEQTLRVFAGWGVSEPLPGKGKKLQIAFPPPAVLNSAVVTIHDRKSTYGKKLYKIEMSSIKNA